MMLKPLLVIGAMLVSNAVSAQPSDGSSAKSGQKSRCKTYQFGCAWKAEVEAQKANPPAPPATTEQQVFVTVQLDVNEMGTVDKCEIVSTDASQKFADGVCPIFVSKAKFKPKVDDKGTAQRQTLTQTVKFAIQN